MTDQDFDDLPSRTLTWCLRAICVVAIGISGYLAWTALKQSDVVGCGDGQIWDCGHVLHSRWSKWLGIPVSIPAFLMYITILCALIVCRTVSNPLWVRFAWGAVTVCGLAAGIAAIWFISLQLFVIRSLCVYCMAAHTCGIMMSALILRSRPLGKNMTSALSGLSIVAACVLVVGQLLSPQSPTYAIERYDTIETLAEDGFSAPDSEEQANSEPFLSAPTEGLFGSPAVESNDDKIGGENQLAPVNPDESLGNSPIGPAQAVLVDSTPPVPTLSPAPNDVAVAEKKESTPSRSPSPPGPADRRLVDVLGGRAQLDVRHWPVVGDLQADYVLVELFDYTCPHCRTMNGHISAARQRYGGRLSVVTLPVPLSRECNAAIASTKARHREACQLARYAIAVWRLDPTAFQQYHEWLFEPAHSRTASEAYAQAAQLVGGREVLQAELDKPIVDQFIAKHVELYKRSGSGTVPKLMFPKVTVRGQMNSLDALCRVLERELNIQR